MEQITIFKFSEKAKKLLKDTDKCDDLLMRINYLHKENSIYRDNLIPEDEVKFTYTMEASDISDISFRFKKLMDIGKDHGLFSDKKTIKKLKKAYKKITKHKDQIEELLTLMENKIEELT